METYSKVASEIPVNKVKPHHIQCADEMLEAFKQMSHGDQVEAFKHLQKSLADHRFTVHQEMDAVHVQHAKEIDALIEGTNHIASAL